MARTAGNVISLAVGAAIGLGIMRLLGFGGGLPAGIFAFLGACVGELIYKAFADTPTENEEQAASSSESESD